MNRFYFLDETKHGFGSAATTSERAKAESVRVESVYSFMRLNT